MAALTALLRRSPSTAMKLSCRPRGARITSLLLRAGRIRPPPRATRHIASYSIYSPPREDPEGWRWPRQNPAENIRWSLRRLSDLSVLSPQWGFVVYRGVYGVGSDAKRDQAIQTIQETVQDELETDYHRGEFMESFEPAEPKAPTSTSSSSVPVTVADIRAQFSKWVYKDIRMSISDSLQCRETL
jgi:hypothetical protein